MRNRKTKRWMAVLLAAASVIGLTACGQSTSGEDNTIYGTVTAIDGSNITLAVGTLNDANQDGQGPQGTPPSMQDGQGPQGTPPAGGQGQRPQGGMLTATGEEKTINVTDESVITVQNNSSGKTGLAAISVGSTLKIVYDSADPGKITSIEVMGGGSMPQGNGKNGAKSTSSPTGTTSPTGTSGTTASPAP